jgi:hypothetical protein
MSWCRAQIGTFDQRYYFFLLFKEGPTSSMQRLLTMVCNTQNHWFMHFVHSNYLEFRAMDKGHKPSDSEVPTGWLGPCMDDSLTTTISRLHVRPFMPVSVSEIKNRRTDFAGIQNERYPIRSHSKVVFHFVQLTVQTWRMNELKGASHFRTPATTEGNINYSATWIITTTVLQWSR